MPVRFDQATAEATAEPAGQGLWAGFGSTELDELIARALEANTTIAQANARLAENRALFRDVHLLPGSRPSPRSRTGSARSISSDDPFAPPGGFNSDIYRAGFDASWEIDLFGCLRNENHAQGRRTEADAASLADAQLSIVAETAQAWFAMIGARERLALRRQQLANLQENVRILDCAGRSRGLECARPRPGGSARCAASPLRCRRPRPTSCARSNGSRC